MLLFSKKAFLLLLISICLGVISYRLSLYTEREHKEENITKIKFPNFLTNDFISNSTNQELLIATRAWPVNSPKGIIILVHGFGEHSGRYEYLAKKFNEMKYSVYANDHIGHGNSDGDRSYIENFDQYTSDVLQFVGIIEEKENAGKDKNLPYFLLGHSMGGLIAVRTAMQTPTLWKGVVISGPALTIPSTPIQIFAKYVSTYFPKLPIHGMSISPSLLSKDDEIVQQYISDPLVYHGAMKALWGSEIIRAMNDVVQNYNKSTFPFFLVHGGDDVICLPEDSQLFFDHSPSLDKQIRIYEGLRHEIFNEIEKDVVISDVIEWIAKRTPQN